MAAGASPSNVATVASVMRDELHRMAEHGITEDELRRTIGNMAGASALALESSDTRMMRLGRSELSTGEFVDRDEALVRLGQVGLDDVAVLAGELASSAMSGVVVGAVAEDVLAEIITAG